MKFNFKDYKKKGGSMEPEEFTKVIGYQPSGIEIQQASEHISSAIKRLEEIFPTVEDSNIVAMIIGALGDGAHISELGGSKETYAIWLLSEAYCLQGKDPQFFIGELIAESYGFF